MEAFGLSSSLMSIVAVESTPTLAPEPGLLRMTEKFSVLSMRLSFRIWMVRDRCVSPGPKVTVPDVPT